MKKLIFPLLAALLTAAVLTGCTEPEPSAPPAQSSAPETIPVTAGTMPEEPAPTAAPVYDPSAVLSEIRPALQCLRACDEEIFGAEVDFSLVLEAGLRDGVPAVLYPEGTPRPEGYEEDPSFAWYYRVTNYSSLSEVRDWLGQYMTPQIIDQITYLDENFLELDGQLYLCRGGRGYGAMLSHIDTAELKEQTETGDCIVTVDYFLFDNYSHTAWLTFRSTPTGWMIVEFNDRVS